MARFDPRRHTFVLKLKTLVAFWVPKRLQATRRPKAEYVHEGSEIEHKIRGYSIVAEVLDPFKSFERL